MKILKKGRNQKGWSKEYGCTGQGNGGGGCGAELLVEEADLFITFSPDRPEPERHVTFECKSCGVLTDVPEGAFPGARGLPSRKDWLLRSDRKAGKDNGQDPLG